MQCSTQLLHHRAKLLAPEMCPGGCVTATQCCSGGRGEMDPNPCEDLALEGLSAGGMLPHPSHPCKLQLTQKCFQTLPTPNQWIPEGWDQL